MQMRKQKNNCWRMCFKFFCSTIFSHFIIFWKYLKMAKTPSKKTAKVAKTASKAGKKSRKGRKESYRYVYLLNIIVKVNHPKSTKWKPRFWSIDIKHNYLLYFMCDNHFYPYFIYSSYIYKVLKQVHPGKYCYYHIKMSWTLWCNPTFQLRLES